MRPHPSISPVHARPLRLFVTGLHDSPPRPPSQRYSVHMHEMIMHGRFLEIREDCVCVCVREKANAKDVDKE